jgi:hypothetical protein
MRLAAILLAALSAVPNLASAGDTAKPSDDEPKTVISPIFDQLVAFTLPPGFTTVFEQPSATSYIREAVPTGETVDKWSQMITVTGAKGASTKPDTSAQLFAAQIAAGFQKACPATFTVKPFGPTPISGEEAFVAVASCGKVDASADKHSETALILAIKGTSDVYTIQWAERAPSNAENLTIDEAKWAARLKQLTPIHVCPIKAGEQPPYPSCAGK